MLSLFIPQNYYVFLHDPCNALELSTRKISVCYISKDPFLQCFVLSIGKSLVAYAPLYFFGVRIYYWIIKCFWTLYFLFQYLLIVKFNNKNVWRLTVLSWMYLIICQNILVFLDYLFIRLLTFSLTKFYVPRDCVSNYFISRYLERSWCLKFSACSSFFQFLSKRFVCWRILLVFFSKICFSRNSVASVVFNWFIPVNNESFGLEVVTVLSCLVEWISQPINFEGLFWNVLFLTKVDEACLKLTYNPKRVGALSLHLFLVDSVISHAGGIRFLWNFPFLMVLGDPKFLFHLLLFFNTLSLSIKTTLLNELWP